MQHGPPNCSRYAACKYDKNVLVFTIPPKTFRDPSSTFCQCLTDCSDSYKFLLKNLGLSVCSLEGTKHLQDALLYRQHMTQTMGQETK